MNDQQPGSHSVDAGELGRVTIEDVVLRRRSGTDLSIRRLKGRWLVLRVVNTAGCLLPPRIRHGFDAVALTVVQGPHEEAPHNDRADDAVVFDQACRLGRLFPGLDWPATFVIDPLGKLAAILNDDSYDVFIHSLMSSNPGAASRGALDLGDIGG